MKGNPYGSKGRGINTDYSKPKNRAIKPYQVDCSCHNCLVKKHCGKVLTMTAEEMNKGCDEKRNVYLRIKDEWRRKPVWKLIDSISDLEYRLWEQREVDKKEGKPLSSKYLKTVGLKIQLAKVIHEILEGKKKKVFMNISERTDDEKIISFVKEDE